MLERMGWGKYRNYFLNTLEFEAGRTVLESYPYRLYIDPTNICQLRCPLCPTGQRVMTTQGQMPLDTFRRIFDVFRGRAEWVGLYNWGEPLLHPDLFEMVRHVTGSGARAMVSTHFSLPFSAEAAREMVAARLSQLIVSLDGATSETYRAYRRGGDFDRVIANLHTLAEARRCLRSRLPEIVVQFIIFRHNEHEIGAVRQLARAAQASLSLIPATCDMGGAVEWPPEEALRRCGDWLPQSPAYRRYDRAGNWVYNTAVCHALWTTSVFRWDGTVFPCCLPYKDEHSLGNIHERPFDEIWNGPLLQHARSLFVGERPGDASLPMVCDLCRQNRGWNVQNLPVSTLRDTAQAAGAALVRKFVRKGSP